MAAACMMIAQIVGKDNTFASNGKFTVSNSVNSVNDVFGSRMLQNQDGSIYFTSLIGDPSTGYKQTALSKINNAGVLDTTFGINGKTVVNSYLNPDSNLQKQPDGKLLMIGFRPGSDNNMYADIVRFLPDGQLDQTFGINGIASFADISSDLDKQYYGLFQQGNKIIFYGEALDGINYLHYRTICRINSNGSIDTSFGNDGKINTQGRFVFQDNASNIISFTNDTPSTGIIEKYDNNGQPVRDFGNDGILTMAFDPGPIAAAIMDSNSNIVYTNRDGDIGRIRPDGNADTSFAFNPSLLPFPTVIFSFVEKNGYYYVGGMNATNNEYFISRLEQNGNINSTFGYFVETDPDLLAAEDLIINDDNVIANGNGYIVKYRSNNSTLSLSDPKLDNRIVFENPIKDDLIYSTNLMVSRINIYSSSGKLVKTLTNGNKHLSGLPKGVYFAEAFTENGITITKKFIKY